MPKERKEREPLDPAEKRPPRPMNMFLFYRGEQIRLAAERGLTGNELKQFTNFTINTTWHAMTKEAKKKYEVMAEAAKEEHIRKYPDYKYQPRTAKEKEALKEYKREQKRLALEERQTSKRAPRKKRADSSDSDVQEIKKEDISPKAKRTIAMERKTSTAAEKYQYYSASAFGSSGPPPDWRRSPPGPSTSSAKPPANTVGPSQMVFTSNQPMYSNAPVMALPYTLHQPPPPGSVYPNQLSAPTQSLTPFPSMPALTDSAFDALNATHQSGYEYSALWAASTPHLDADRADSPDDDGATPESVKFSEPLYPGLWNNLGQGVNPNLAAPSDNFNDYVNFPPDPTDGGTGGGDLPPPTLAVRDDYTNWKGSMSRHVSGSGRSVSVEVKIPENVANSGGQTSQALADQMISQLTMVSSVQQQQDQQQQPSFGINFDPTIGQMEFSRNVAFDRSSVLSFMPVPTGNSGVAFGAGGGDAPAGEGCPTGQFPPIHTGVPQIYKEGDGGDVYSTWAHVLGDGFEGNMDFMTSDALTLSPQVGGGCGASADISPADVQNLFDMMNDANSGPTPAAGSEQEQSRLFKQHDPDWLAQLSNNNLFGAGESGGDMAEVEELHRGFDGVMSFKAESAPAEAPDELPSSVIYHHSPPPLAPLDLESQPEHPKSFPASYVPPSGASKFAERRVGGKWQQRRPQMDRVSSMQSVYSDYDQQPSPTSPAGQSYTLADNSTDHRFQLPSAAQSPAPSTQNGWYQQQQQSGQDQDQSGMMLNLNASMAFAGNNGKPSPNSYMASYSTMRRVSEPMGPPPPVKMESRPTRSVMSGLGAASASPSVYSGR
ncbi:hypothetical protein FRB94_014245 [Tulasnella sp. JGI-2019a]|nr:hypothetical protein FRB93_005406 [Tulasnella sp. JGI-2019a]KAG9014152.1 hypothetical protein FRB94_014245 [Tulasnella sp. JGI-2019a]